MRELGEWVGVKRKERKRGSRRGEMEGEG